MDTLIAQYNLNKHFEKKSYPPDISYMAANVVCQLRGTADEYLL